MLNFFLKASYVNMILSAFQLSLLFIITVIQYGNAANNTPPKQEVYESCTRKEDPSSILKHPKCLV